MRRYHLFSLILFLAGFALVLTSMLIAIAEMRHYTYVRSSATVRDLEQQVKRAIYRNEHAIRSLARAAFLSSLGLLLVAGGVFVQWLRDFPATIPQANHRGGHANTLDIYTPITWRSRVSSYFRRGSSSRLSGRLDLSPPASLRRVPGSTMRTITPVYSNDEIGEHAMCPYCSSNLQETFDEMGRVIKCNRCGAFQHLECFQEHGHKCVNPHCR